MFFKTFDYWTFLVEIPKKNSILISITFFFNILFFTYPEFIVIFLYNIILKLFY
jgi:hypothetical protein